MGSLCDPISYPEYGRRAGDGPRMAIVGEKDDNRPRIAHWMSDHFN